MAKESAVQDAGSLANWISAGRDDDTENRVDAIPDSIESLRAQNEDARDKIKKVVVLQRY